MCRFFLKFQKENMNFMTKCVKKLIYRWPLISRCSLCSFSLVFCVKIYLEWITESILFFGNKKGVSALSMIPSARTAEDVYKCQIQTGGYDTCELYFFSVSVTLKKSSLLSTVELLLGTRSDGRWKSICSPAFHYLRWCYVQLSGHL